VGFYSEPRSIVRELVNEARAIEQSVLYAKLDNEIDEIALLGDMLYVQHLIAVIQGEATATTL